VFLPASLAEVRNVSDDRGFGINGMNGSQVYCGLINLTSIAEFGLFLVSGRQPEIKHTEIYMHLRN
jgi:hypothetical protein